MYRALRRMAAIDVGRLPVVAADDHSVLVGLIRRADVVVAGGTEAAIHPLPMAAFAKMQALSTRTDDPAGAFEHLQMTGDGREAYVEWLGQLVHCGLAACEPSEYGPACGIGKR